MNIHISNLETHREDNGGDCLRWFDTKNNLLQLADGSYALVEITAKVVHSFADDFDYVHSDGGVLNKLGIAQVEKDEGLWGYINTEGRILVPPIYEDTMVYIHQDKPFVVATLEGSPRIIDIDNNVLVPPGYDKIKYAGRGEKCDRLLFFAIKNKKGGLIDHTGKIIIPVRYGELGVYEEKFIYGEAGEEKTLFDLDGSPVEKKRR